MRIGWWAEVSITPDTFVFGTPNNHVPLIRALERRGHTVELIHVPWRANGEWVLEKPEHARLRSAENLEAAVVRRKSIEELVAVNSGLDATMRTFRAAAAQCHMYEPASLPYDVVFMKLPPPGFLRTKVEVVYNLWRFMQAGVPVFVFDGDLMWEQAVEWVYFPDSPPGACGMLHARTPYVPRKPLPNWRFQPYWYDEEDELPLLSPSDEPWPKVHDLGYVGNDWKQADSPRAEGLQRFYGEGQTNAVWGRWTEENQALTGLAKEVFRGPINAGHVRLMYQKCKASVVLGLPAYYKVGLVTQRYREIIQGGALCLIDGRYPRSITDKYVDPTYRVATNQDVLAWLTLIDTGGIDYLSHLRGQRAYACNNPDLRLISWVHQLEALAGVESKT